MSEDTGMRPVAVRVLSVADQVFGLAEGSVAPDATPQQIEAWDSMGHLMLVMALEQEFAVQFSPEQAEAMADIPAIIDIVTQVTA